MYTCLFINKYTCSHSINIQILVHEVLKMTPVHANIFPPMLVTGADDARMHKKFTANLARDGYLKA